MILFTITGEYSLIGCLLLNRMRALSLFFSFSISRFIPDKVIQACLPVSPDKANIAPSGSTSSVIVTEKVSPQNNRYAIISGGRYFNTHDARSKGHQLSKRILENKDPRKSQDEISKYIEKAFAIGYLIAIGSHERHCANVSSGDWSVLNNFQ